MAMIRIWVYDGILASGVAGPVDVFTAANEMRRGISVQKERTTSSLTWRVESQDGKPIRCASGQTIMVDGKIDGRAHADAILVTAPFVSDMDNFIGRREQIQDISSALRRQHEAGAVMASYCTGSYLLAEAGLLDGRIAATHWAKVRDFAQRYPRVELRAHAVLTEQNGVICGGAVTSFLDVALRLVKLFAGAQVAAATGKLLLIDPSRVSQAPYATLLQDHGHADHLVARAQRRMEADLQQKFSLSELAAHLAVSERTLHRRFKRAVGEAPLEYLQTLRVEVAKRALESGRISAAAAGQLVGYADFSTFRQLFKRKTGLSPREYQGRFVKVTQFDESKSGPSSAADEKT
jgi:transcriptional regulator GlxA family with amidase domain